MDSIQNYMGVTIQSFMVRVHDSSKAICKSSKSETDKVYSYHLTNCRLD